MYDVKVIITTFRRGVTTGARVYDQPAKALPPLLDKFWDACQYSYVETIVLFSWPNLK